MLEPYYLVPIEFPVAIIADITMCLNYIDPYLISQ
jgi:hypothetical protein